MQKIRRTLSSFRGTRFPVYTRKSVFLIILLISILVVAGCSDHPSGPRPKAENGILDISQVKFDNHIIQLDGEWEFYWNQLLKPNEITSDLMTGYIDIPSSWNNYSMDKGSISGFGYATYRLTIMADQEERLAFKIPRVFTAYKLWINGELSASAGETGKTRDTSRPQYLPQVAFFEAQPGNNEIVIQVSNFYHRSGGILEAIKLGNEQKILDLRYKNIAYNIFLFGCLIFMGVYHLTLSFFRKKNNSSLYFGLFCVLISIRTLLVGECFFIYLFPGFSWEIAHKLMSQAFYLGTPIILLFFRSFYPKYFDARFIKIALIIGIAYGFLLLTPARFFTHFNPPYQVWAIIAIMYIFIALIRIAINKEKDSWLIILGAIALLLTTVNDMVFLSIWMNDEASSFLRALFRTGNLTSFGQLVFAFAISLLLAKRFSDSLEQEEIMTVELTELNENLDKIISNRTEDLVESNERIEQQRLELEKANRQLQEISLKDPLTNLWNRRKYNETMNLEWNRCLRYERPIALLILDIDCFKGYNDYHGHIAGDECLIKIGQTIGDSLSRSTDMVARYGGEEFIVVLPETEKEEAIEIADMLRRNVEALQIPHGQSPVSNFVTISIGVSYTIPNTNTSSEDLLKVADKALYLAKAEGRNQVKFLYE